MFPDGKCVVEGKDPDFFFPDGTRSGRSPLGMSKEEAEEWVANTYCARCPRQLDCAEFAIAEGWNHGVWGFSAIKRNDIRSARERRNRSKIAI